MDGGASSRHERAFPADAASARAAREFVVAALLREGASPTTVANFRLVVSELVSNVVEHANTGAIVRINASDDGWFEVDVIGGHPLPETYDEPAQWTIAPPISANGRGLGIARALMDEIGTATAGDVLMVRCRSRR